MQSFKISIWNPQGYFLTSILIILQNLVKWPCPPEAAFPENGLSELFGLCWPMIYRPDQFCQSLFLVSRLLIELAIWQKLHGHKLGNFQDLRGGGYQLHQEPLSYQKEQIPLIVNILQFGMNSSYKKFVVSFNILS